MRSRHPLVVLAWSLLLAPAAAAGGHAADGAEPAPEAAEAPAPAPAAVPRQPSKVFDHLLVTGGPEQVERLPGSATFIGLAELRRQDHTDLQRILHRVPGLNIQEEEGYGLRPNIGMRGTGVERSQKITLLEDGVPIAPAPYSAPAAYYAPTAGRMESVEVRKGSSSIRHGPFTTGGVINLVSAGIPDRLVGRVRLGAGDRDTLRLQADAGDSSERFGWLLQGFHFDTDGFKDLDGGGPTGVRLSDYLGKLRVQGRGDARLYQALELKLGQVDQAGEETYLGLTREDFARTPYRRYAASQADFLDSEHRQVQARYFLQPAPGLDLTVTGYRNDFFRNWHKLQSVGGLDLATVLDQPGLYPLELALLRGERDDDVGALRLRNNRRDYYSQGIEVLAGWRFRTGGLDHRLELGVRRHEDEEDRFQEEDLWSMVGGRMRFVAAGAPGSQSNRIAAARATAYYVRDEIALGRWRLSPGVRFEDVDFRRRDYGTADPLRSGAELAVRRNRSREWIPGFGLAYEVSERWSLFGGVHRGFAPPEPGAETGVRPEESLNYEAGFNYRRSLLGARVVAFVSNYDNLLGRDTLSSGGAGTGASFNGGEALVRGLEASLDYDPGRARGWSVSLPVRLSYTWTEAEFETSFATSFADWAPAVEAGDRLPYLPEHLVHLAVGASMERWSVDLDAAYTGAMRSHPGQGPIPAATRIDGRLVLDLAAGYEVLPRLELFARVRNLTDDPYLAARRPAGARPGMPRTVLVGVSWER